MSRAAARASMCSGVALAGAFGAWRLRWLSDDAFISFRYAENLVAGHGLVFNVGEHVEGMTNFLWTLWIALGVALGSSAETWSLVWGALAFGAAAGGLAWIGLRDTPADAPLPLPWAGLLFALHPDAQIFGTAGLETSAVCCALVYAVMLVTGPVRGRAPLARRAAAAGALTGIAAGLRPDAILLAPLVAAVPLLPRLPGFSRLVPGSPDGARPDDLAWTWSCTLWLTAGVLAIWLPLNGFRVAYYGDFFPNTYYAKSADLTWWSQGWAYLRTYLLRYGAHLTAIPLAIAALAAGDPQRRWIEIYIGLGFALVYALYVTRVGGDFMYARLLIPTVPMLALAFEAGLSPLSTWTRSVIGVVAIALPWFLSVDLRGTWITHEREFYVDATRSTRWDDRSRILEHYFADLDVGVAFLGTWARNVRDADIDPAVEAETGLTDARIARQVLTQRGKPGHEKRADPHYLADERRLAFTMGEASYETLGLQRIVPPVEVILSDPDRDSEVHIFVLRWHPEVMETLRKRGAKVPDLPAAIEGLGVSVGETPIEECRDVYAQLQRLYFDQVDDPERRRPFEARCPADPD